MKILLWFNKSDTILGGIITTQLEVSNGKKSRTFSKEFKLEAACLVLDKGYSIQEACHFGYW